MWDLSRAHSLSSDLDLQPGVRERVISSADYAELVQAGLGRAADVDQRVNANIASRCGYLLNELSGRISFKETDVRYFEGVLDLDGKLTREARRKVQRSDLEGNLYDPNFQAPTPLTE